jgi:hypothetical protein
VSILASDSESLRIARPAAVVWALVGDPTIWPRWADDLDDVRVHGELVVGTAITYTHRGRSVRAPLTAYEHERAIKVADSEESYEVRESTRLAEDEVTTMVSTTMDAEPTAWWARLVAPLVIPFKGIVLGRGSRRSLLALQRAAENQD